MDSTLTFSTQLLATGAQVRAMLTTHTHTHTCYTLTPSPLPSFTCHTHNHTSLSSTPPSHHLSPPHTTLTTSPLHMLHSRPYLFSITLHKLLNVLYSDPTPLGMVYTFLILHLLPSPTPSTHTQTHTHAHSTHRTNFHGSIG